jgi:hypothetical protein
VAQEPVEIKVNVAGAVPAAIGLLSLDEGEPREIYFVEDLTPGLSSAFPLLAAGVVLRLRVEADGSGDSTVKLRPCRRSQLARDWSEPAAEKNDWEYRIEGDWTGARHVLAASYVKELAAADLAAGVQDPVQAFVRKQLDFIEACAPIRINLAALTVLGPIAATRWTKIDVGSVGKVNAERWQIGALDFLELSRKVDADEAELAQAELSYAAVRAGLAIDRSSASKTEQVLEVLVSRHR